MQSHPMGGKYYRSRVNGGVIEVGREQHHPTVGVVHLPLPRLQVLPKHLRSMEVLRRRLLEQPRHSRHHHNQTTARLK